MVPDAPFNGSTQEKSSSEIFRFGCRKAASDKKVPDPVTEMRDHMRVTNAGSACLSVV